MANRGVCDVQPFLQTGVFLRQGRRPARSMRSTRIPMRNCGVEPRRTYAVPSKRLLCVRMMRAQVGWKGGQGLADSSFERTSSFFWCARRAARRLISFLRAFRSSSVISSPLRGRPRLRECGLPPGLLPGEKSSIRSRSECDPTSAPGEPRTSAPGEPTTGAPGAVRPSDVLMPVSAGLGDRLAGGGSTGRGISIGLDAAVCIPGACGGTTGSNCGRSAGSATNPRTQCKEGRSRRGRQLRDVYRYGV